MKSNPVMRITAKLMIPVILLFAMYVQFHGEYGPGGGFQAGVIFASAFIFHAMVFGLEATRAIIPPPVLRALMSAGLLLFAGVGTATVVLGGGFLDYDLLASSPVTGQHLGIFLVELGVGITVASVLIAVFLAFAGRERR